MLAGAPTASAAYQADRPIITRTANMLDERRIDPVGFWLRRATARANALRLSQDTLLESAAIVSGALTRDWLMRSAKRKVPRKAAIFDTHPLVEAFTVDGDDHIVLIAEIADYLRGLHGRPGIDLVLAGLRDPQGFDSTVLQLAWAWRLQANGGEVSLEPSAHGGRRGDIAVAWRGHRAIFECFVAGGRPSFRREVEGFKDFMAYSLSKFSEAARDCGKRVRVSVRFRSALNHSDRGEVERATVEAIRAVPANGRTSADVSCAAIEVEDLPEGLPDADFRADGSPDLQAPHLRDVMGVMATFEAPASLATRPLEGVPIMSRQRGTRILWYGPPQLTERIRSIDVQRLASAIEKKFSQTRPAVGDAARIVIAQSGWVDARLPEAMPYARALGELIFHRERSIDGLVLVGRHFHVDRYRYTTFWLPGPSCPMFVDELVAACARLDAHDGAPEHAVK